MCLRTVRSKHTLDTAVPSDPLAVSHWPAYPITKYKPD